MLQGSSKMMGRCRVHATVAMFMAMLWCTAAGAASIVNGSFEVGPAPGQWITLPSGSTSITGWTVIGHSIDYQGSVWEASDGDRSLDLSGNAAGGIAQVVTTVPGITYELSFDLAGNVAGPPGIYEVRVTTGSSNQTFGFDTTGYTLQNMGWQTVQLQFTAGSQSTTLAFESLVPGYYGPAIDNVGISEVTVVPEPSTAMLTGVALAGLAGLRRRRSRA